MDNMYIFKVRFNTTQLVLETMGKSTIKLQKLLDSKYSNGSSSRKVIVDVAVVKESRLL